jgi:hypothetical protein
VPGTCTRASQYCCETIKGWAGLSSSCVLLPGTANIKSTIDRLLSSRSCQSVLLSHPSFLLVPVPENIRSRFLKIVITRSITGCTTRPLNHSSTVLIYHWRNVLHLALPAYTSSTTSHISKYNENPPQQERQTERQRPILTHPPRSHWHSAITSEKTKSQTRPTLSSQDCPHHGLLPPPTTYSRNLQTLPLPHLHHHPRHHRHLDALLVAPPISTP